MPPFELDWVQVESQGLIYSWERCWHLVHPALIARPEPYMAVLVELPKAGTVRMIGDLLGDPHQEMVIGTPVEVVFEHHRSAHPPYTLAHWRLASGN